METERDGLFTYHRLSEKERKNLNILELIRKKGPISRTEISKITDINIVSVSNYVKEYLDKGLVLEKGLDASSGGRRPELIEMNKEEGHLIGVDIDSADIRACITNLSMDTVKKCVANKGSSSQKELEESVLSLLRELIGSSGVPAANIKAIGIGTGDGKRLGLQGAVEKELGIQTFIGSDAACAAFGEKTINPQADVSELLYMYSDVGCGIIIRGDIYFGAGGDAGDMELSSSNMSKEEEAVLLRDSRYLRPWSPYFGIINSAKREIDRGVGTKMVAIAQGDPKKVTKEVVIEAARQNDEIALYIIENAAMNLGLRIAYLVNLFNPELVVVGGGIEKAGQLILRPIADKVKKFAFGAQADMVKIIPSTLGEDSVSLGAASLAARELFLRA